MTWPPRPTGWWCWTSSPTRSPTAPSTSPRSWPCSPTVGVQHVVVTGRRADPALVDAADLVTDMTKVKHPMDAGRKGQAGIEW